MNGLRNHLAENARRNGKAALGHQLGHIGEVFSPHREHGKSGFAAGERAIAVLADVDGQLVFGHDAHGLIETLCVDDVFSFSFDGDGLEDRADSFVHIVGGDPDLPVLHGLHQHAFNRGDGILVGYRPHGGGQSVQKYRFLYNEFHNENLP